MKRRWKSRRAKGNREPHRKSGDTSYTRVAWARMQFHSDTLSNGSHTRRHISSVFSFSLSLSLSLKSLIFFLSPNRYAIIKRGPPSPPFPLSHAIHSNPIPSIFAFSSSLLFFLLHSPFLSFASRFQRHTQKWWLWFPKKMSSHWFLVPAGSCSVTGKVAAKSSGSSLTSFHFTFETWVFVDKIFSFNFSYPSPDPLKRKKKSYFQGCLWILESRVQPCLIPEEGFSVLFSAGNLDFLTK